MYTGDKTTLKGELVTDESGYSNTLSYSTDKLNTDLEPIYIKETQAPDGYKLDDSDELIEIKSHIDSNGNIKLIDPINTDDIQMEVTTIDNIPTIVLVKYDNPDTVKYNIKIVKKDADTNKEIGRADRESAQASGLVRHDLRPCGIAAAAPIHHSADHRAAGRAAFRLYDRRGLPLYP